MRTDDKREKLQQRIAEDIAALRSMGAADDTLVQGYLRVIATGRTGEAREMLSLLMTGPHRVVRCGC